MNTFSSWCIQNKVYTNEISKCTHLLLNGGKLCIQESIMDSFLDAYIDALKNDEELYIVERVSRDINLFLDIDTKSSDLDCDLLVQNIQDLLKSFTINIYKCNVTNGYHIIFPGYIVTPNEAIKIVVALQNKLVQKFDYSIDNIKKTIDLSVYKTGLRMIGSYKKNELRCYLPINGKRTLLNREDILKSLIRQSYDLPISSSNSRTISVKHDNIIKEIQRLNSNFQNLKITKISKLGDTFCIYTDCHFCMNKGSSHTKEVVYFIVTQDKKIYQKCFCSNSTSRLNGTCSSFKSKSIPISHKVYFNLQKN